VLAAEFQNDGRRFTAFRYQLPDEGPAYYDENGRSLKRMFLKSPLPFTPRVTSRFSRRRLHPVLKTYRPHLGVDYRAATGTSVRTVASGRVVSAGWSGGSGQMVRVRHSDGYETYYLHLSAITRGIVAGARVSQGQQIGRVGSTGLATAPHLDYRVKKDGRFLNPTTVHRSLPPGKPIPPEYLGEFESVRDMAVSRLFDPSTIRLARIQPLAADAEPAP
jgi:murein DD-endopeptidase MepM/ murein hydrolase activator NlpD